MFTFFFFALKIELMDHTFEFCQFKL